FGTPSRVGFRLGEQARVRTSAVGASMDFALLGWASPILTLEISGQRSSAACRHAHDPPGGSARWRL
ncbi:MAG TPA: hypothetical protein VEF89_05500, partial [Solirubrobacteraceae bacterium]|nr:hypothetical protein [Solirubrobacteraceae bacterium]